MAEIYRHMGSKNYDAAVANEIINLTRFVIDGVAADVSGPILARPGDDTERGLQILVDNTKGTGDAYFATKAEIDAHVLTTAESLGALVVAPGQKDTFGPFDWQTFNLLLVQLIGAEVRVSVESNGAAY
jgi:hypothetical protein